MVLPGHLAAGYLATQGVLHFLPGVFDPSQTLVLTIFGTLAGDLPDLDLVLYFFHKKINPKITYDHRYYPSHTPLFWLVIFANLLFYNLLFGNFFGIILAFLVLAGSLSHLIFDSIEYGVIWLWPFSDKRYKLFQKIPSDNNTSKPKSLFGLWWKFIKGPYLRTKTVWVEVILTILAFVYWLSIA